MDYKERPILVTGADGGIGSALVDYLMTNGYKNVICQYRNKYDTLYKIFARHDRDFDRYCIRAELTDESQVNALHDAVFKHFNIIWGLINVAGASSNGMSWKMQTSEFTRVLNENLLTTFMMCRAFSPDMRNQSGGRIINTSSVVAFTGGVGCSHYCAAKAAIIGYSKSLSLELASKNITVNTLGLGYFDCGLINQIPDNIRDDIKAKTPVKRFGDAHEIGGLVDYLLSDSGGFTTGQVHHINGGFINA